MLTFLKTDRDIFRDHPRSSMVLGVLGYPFRFRVCPAPVGGRWRRLVRRTKRDRKDGAYGYGRGAARRLRLGDGASAARAVSLKLGSDFWETPSVPTHLAPLTFLDHTWGGWRPVGGLGGQAGIYM